MALGERGKNLTKPCRARHGVELGGVRQTRRRIEIVVRAERDDQKIRLVGSAIGRHALGDGIDQRDRFLEQTHAGLHEILIRQSHRVERRAPEHHVELRVAEGKGVAFVDQRHIDAIAERLRERGAEFEPTEAGSENEDVFFHRIVELIVICSYRSAAN